MNPYRRGVEALQALNDAELVAAYEAYVTRLEQLLGPDEIELYRSYQQRAQSSGAPRPEELDVAAKVDADPELQPLYERYLALLGDRQAHPHLQEPQAASGGARVY
jgi:hypothetical protein